MFSGKLDKVGRAHKVRMLCKVQRDLVNVAGVGHADVIGSQSFRDPKTLTACKVE